MDSSVGPFGLIGLTAVGFALLWARQVIYRRRFRESQDVPRLVMSLAANLLIVVGLVGAAAHFTLIFAPISCAALLIFVAMFAMHYRAVERRALLKCIAVAAEKGIPLVHAVRGFANERTDELGYRAERLATALERGVSLPEALQQSRTVLSIESLLAMRLGYETGALGPAVARLSKSDEQLDAVSRSVFEKFMYLGVLILVAFTCTTFMAFRIAPVIERLFQEFEIETPMVTQYAFTVTNSLMQFGIFVVPILLVLLVFVALAVLHYIGFLPGDFPGLSWFTRRQDAALVMRSLALGIARSWPLNKTVWMLSRIYPKRSMRKRLASAGNRIDNGEHWCDSLWRAGVIGRVDRDLIAAANRLQNAEWALDELAESSVRRLIYRWRVALNFAFPMILLLFGAFIALFAIGYFLPLVQLIQGLT